MFVPSIVGIVFTLLAAFTVANEFKTRTFSSNLPSSTSSSGYCDPCCVGVHKLTYQAPFKAGIYLSCLSQQFTSIDLFGPEACYNLYNVATSAGVTANLIGSDGLDVCAPQAVATAIAQANYVDFGNQAGVYYHTAEVFSAAAFNYDPTNSVSAAAVVTTGAAELEVLNHYLVLAKAAQATASDPASRTLADSLVTTAQLAIQYTTMLIDNAKARQPNIYETVGRQFEQAFYFIYEHAVDLTVSTTLYLASDVQYGTFYTVSRAWSLNRPIYTISNGLVSAAKSISNCEGEYRAVYLTKPLSDMPYTVVNNNNDDCCCN